MPPPKSGKVLSPAQTETIRRWIAEGAKWQPHWAFIPPQRPPIPRVERMGWVRNPIDAFVLARLEREGLSPRPMPSAGILLRRVTLDLTGLPPTPAEIGRVRTRPRTGRIRPGRRSPPALAPVRRTHGRPMARRRRAMPTPTAIRPTRRESCGDGATGSSTPTTSNRPFDRFTIEQLAGDLLPGATLDQRIATGFNRNHRGNAEGGIIPEEYAAEYVVDRVDTTATVWLGLTIGCARCHDHKFDPVTQQDYYRLFAFFNNVPENGRAVKYGNSPPLIKAPTRAQQEELDRLRHRIAGLERDWQHREPEIASSQSAWESSIRQRPGDRLVSRGAPDLPDPGFKPSARTPAHNRSTPAMSRGFGFYDRFTLAARIKPAGPRGGTILSRMSDEPQGDGYSVVLDRGKIRSTSSSDGSTMPSGSPRKQPSPPIDGRTSP